MKVSKSHYASIVALSLAALLFFSLSACGNSDQEKSAPGATAVTLVIYNGQHKDASTQLEKDFTAATGIKFEDREGGSNELTHQIIEEGDQSPADLIYTEEITPLEILQAKGLLAPVGAAAQNNIPKLYADPQGQWAPLTIRSRVVVYNTAMVKPSDLPKSMFGFLKPEWKGKFAYIPTSGAFQQQLSAIIKLKGVDEAKAFLEGLKKYGTAYSGNKTALNAVESGEIATAFINNYYWDRLAKENGVDNMHSKLYYFGTNDLGEMLTFSGIAVLKSSKNQEAAQQFIAFMTSKHAQQILTDSSSQYPVNLEVVNSSLKPFSDLAPPNEALDLGEYSDGALAIKLLQEAGML